MTKMQRSTGTTSSTISVDNKQTEVEEGTIVNLYIAGLSQELKSQTSNLSLVFKAPFQSVVPTLGELSWEENILVVPWDTTDLSPGLYSIASAQVHSSKQGSQESIVNVSPTTDSSGDGNAPETDTPTVNIKPRSLSHGDSVPVTMRRTAQIVSNDLPLWLVIKGSSDALSFDNYKKHMDLVLCGVPFPGAKRPEATKNAYADLKGKRFLPFTDSDAYRLLKVATEAFVMTNCGVALGDYDFTQDDTAELLRRVEVSVSRQELGTIWKAYLKNVNGTPDLLLPYFQIIQQKFPDIALKEDIFLGCSPAQIKEEGARCYGLLRKKLQEPCLLELMWSYWQEEGMLVQTMGAITQRFQNKRSASGQDPLANLETDPLRPLNNLLWGYVQDEIHRLTVVRRAYEYDHHYGLRIFGKAIPEFRPADSRSKFIEAFHNLLNLCTKFYKGDDDTTVIADGFPVLNALRDVHLLLSEGAHNQFGDLPATARIEMLMQQWMLARPEFLQFLPTRTMVAYPEPWMDRVDAMKKLQGWTDVNVLHFRNLGVFGEQVLLSIRYGAWSDTNDPKQAANWARFWRAEVQGYIHAYRAVTGVDLSTDAAGKVDTTLPAIHLRNRLLSQMRTPQEQNTLTIPRSRVS